MKQSHPLLIAALAWGLFVPLLLLDGCADPREGYQPYQPIFFRHSRMAGPEVWETNDKGEKVNVGGYNIPCRYCHTMVDKGRHATIASMDICMNCHTYVGQDKEWVIKLKDHWDNGEPIQWVKVHDLPDFVYFDHSPHLNARDDQNKQIVDCVDCHGEVEKTERVSIVNAFNMGWCLECHRKPEMNARTDCTICHR